MYKADSKIAEEFIDHQEILDTLEYAHNNKSNRALIEQLIDKAAQFKGLSHREAALLLECDQPDLTERIFRLAQEIKHKFYGNRIVMFAPLYLSNYCVNGCVYCPYHLKNKTIARKKLTQEEIRKEVIALQDMGHKRLALEAGIRCKLTGYNGGCIEFLGYTPETEALLEQERQEVIVAHQKWQAKQIQIA